MYKIIGADQKEYGPVTPVQIRQWIAEGRANAQTMVLPEGGTQWVPLSALPEFADALGIVPNAPPPFSSQATGGAAVSAEELIARDYSLDIGSCISRAWELVKANFWPVVGVNFLVMVVMVGVNQIIGLFSHSAWNEIMIHGRTSVGGVLAILATAVIGFPVSPILMGGLFKYYLKLIRGQNSTLGDAFSGFGPSLGQLALLGLVQGLLASLGFLFCILPGIYLSVAWYFAMPLVIDRQMDFWPAMELSRRVVTKHWFVVFAMGLVAGLAGAVGVLACCVGVLVSVPLGMIAIVYAYEDIFGQQRQ